MNCTERLFSYGTLCYEPVQLSTFGRTLDGSKETLIGFALQMVEIEDPYVISISRETHHPILIYTGNPQDAVEGIVFSITTDELLQADTYEVDDYKRVFVKLLSGEEAWVYISQELTPPEVHQ